MSLGPPYEQGHDGSWPNHKNWLTTIYNLTAGEDCSQCLRTDQSCYWVRLDYGWCYDNYQVMVGVMTIIWVDVMKIIRAGLAL